MVQHELLLGVVHRTVRTLEDRHFLTGYVLVKVCVEQSLLGKNRVAHGTLVDQPAKQRITVKRVFLNAWLLVIACVRVHSYFSL